MKYIFFCDVIDKKFTIKSLICILSYIIQTYNELLIIILSDKNGHKMAENRVNY